MLSFHFFLFTFHYKQLFTKETNRRTCKTKQSCCQQKQLKDKKMYTVEGFCCCTWLCFLCCCLLVSTLGVTCINQLCSVFRHQFDHSWKTKQNHVLYWNTVIFIHTIILKQLIYSLILISMHGNSLDQWTCATDHFNHHQVRIEFHTVKIYLPFG